MTTFVTIHSASQIMGLLGPLVRGHAYLDPGTGSFLLQLLIATLLGALFLLRGYFGKVVNFFRRLFTRSGSKQDEQQ